MSLFGWLFKKKNNTIECPRCLGKGHVDQADIKRLKMELQWRPGRCAYCNGIGTVLPSMVDNVAVDEAYLTANLAEKERMLLINRDPEAVMNAISHQKNSDEIIEQILHLYEVEKLEAADIVHYLMQFVQVTNEEEYAQAKEDVTEYVAKVIEVKGR